MMIPYEAFFFPPVEKQLSVERDIIGGKKKRPGKPAGRSEAWIWAQMLVFARVYKLFIIFGVPNSPARPGHGPASPGLGLAIKITIFFYFPKVFLHFRDFGTIRGAQARNQLIN